MFGIAVVRSRICSFKGVAAIRDNQCYFLGSSLKDYLNLSPNTFERFLKAEVEEEGGQSKTSLDDVEILAPVTDNHFTVYCVGKNYLDHVKEVQGTALASADGIPKYPIIFSKALSSLAATQTSVEIPTNVTQKVDYEGELGVVIGKPGKRISKENAFDHVFGLTVVNDISARDTQTKHVQWLLGKSMDGFCPIGPWIVPFSTEMKKRITSDGLSIKTTVNGELRQDGNTKDMIFDIPTLIEEISKGTTLNSGDIIATGTPSGVGAGLSPPQFLNKGDRVIVSIEGIGDIANDFI